MFQAIYRLSGNVPVIKLMHCWFSLESTMAIYDGFLDLDTSQSGMLTEVFGVSFVVIFLYNGNFYRLK